MFRAARRPLPHYFVLASVLGIVVAARPARAVNSVQGVATASVGYDSNILAQPSDTPGGRIADGEGMVSLGVIYTSALARIQQQLSYQFAGLLYFDHVDNSNYSNRLDWRGAFETSRTTTLRLNVGFAQAQINSILNAGAAGTTQPTLTNTNDVQALTVLAGASLLWEVRARTRMIFSSNFSTLISLGETQPTTYFLQNLVELDQLFRRDAIGFSLGADETVFGDTRGPVMRPDGTTDPNGVVTAGYQLLLLRALGEWKRDLSPFWNIHLSLGVVSGFQPNDVSAGVVVQPAAQATLRYFNRYIIGELQYRHDVAPNILVAQAFVIDSGLLRFTAPLGATTHLVAGVSGGYQYLQDLLPNGSVSGSAQLAMADGSLAYTPRAGITVFARYQFTKQLDVHAGADYTVNPFVRHVATLGVSFIYPAQSAVPGPPHPGARVDGADGTYAPPVHTPVLAPTAAAN